jgi:hypothetical protein
VTHDLRAKRGSLQAAFELWCGWYSSAWVGYYEPPTVSEYEIVTAETSLYGLDARRLIWSGTTETFSPQDIRKETREYAQVI